MSSRKNDIFSESFSIAGKDSLRLYNINFKKKLKKIRKENLLFNSYLFSIKKIEDDSNIYKLKPKNDILNDDDLFFSKYKEKNKNLFQGEKYKYHKKTEKLMVIKRKKMKLIKDKDISTTNLTKININDSNSQRKTKLILNWKKLIGRNPINKQKENEIKNLSDIDIKTYNYKNVGFIDMSKQTQRNDSIFLSGDIRKINLKQYIGYNFRAEKEKWEKFCKEPLVARSPFSSDIENKYGEGRKIFAYSCKNNKKNLNFFLSDDYNNNKNNLLSNKYNSVIDFKKILSRQKFVKNKKEIIIKTELKPNYNYINDRLKIFKYRKEKKLDKKIDLRNLDWDKYYPTKESFENIYDHKLKSVPNFMQMMPRPDDNILPSFMNGIHNGMSEFNPKVNLIYDYSTDRYKNGNEETNNKLKKQKSDKNKKNKSKCLLNKFIKLYGELFYPSK